MSLFHGLLAWTSNHDELFVVWVRSVIEERAMGTKVDEKEADLALLETLESGSEFYLSYNKSC